MTDLDKRWVAVAEGMTFFGESVKDMNAEKLLRLVGFLAEDNERLRWERRGVCRFSDAGKSGEAGNLTLTAEEREAINVARIELYATQMFVCHHSHTLLKLLERTQ